jgi:hypothetical protein
MNVRRTSILVALVFWLAMHGSSGANEYGKFVPFAPSEACDLTVAQLDRINSLSRRRIRYGYALVKSSNGWILIDASSSRANFPTKNFHAVIRNGKIRFISAEEALSYYNSVYKNNTPKQPKSSAQFEGLDRKYACKEQNVNVKL